MLSNQNQYSTYNVFASNSSWRLLSILLIVASIEDFTDLVAYVDNTLNCRQAIFLIIITLFSYLKTLYVEIRIKCGRVYVLELLKSTNIPLCLTYLIKIYRGGLRHFLKVEKMEWWEMRVSLSTFNWFYYKEKGAIYSPPPWSRYCS